MFVSTQDLLDLSIHTLRTLRFLSFSFLTMVTSRIEIKKITRGRRRFFRTVDCNKMKSISWALVEAYSVRFSIKKVGTTEQKLLRG
jgi:phage tail sheath gpL-like